MMPGILAGAMGQGGAPPPSGQTFSFDPAYKNANVTLTSSDKVATATTGNHLYCLCTNPRTTGKYQFELIVTSMPSSTGNITIGLAPQAATGNNTSTATAYFSSGPAYWTRISASAARFYYSNAYDALSTPGDVFADGDVIGLAVDFSTKDVSVYKNGILVYTRNVPGIDPSSFVYVPAVKLWGTAGKSAIVTIPGSITYPVSGFTAWA